MKNKIKKMGGVFLLCALMVMLLPAYRAEAAVTSITWSGTNITGSSVDVSTELGDSGDSTINFTTASALTADGNVLRFTLNGAVVMAGQTLAVTDLTIAGLTLEASPGTGDNGSAEVTITNGAAGNSNPVIEVVLDSNSGTPPNFTAAANTLVIADGQLESSATPGNYSLAVVTTNEIGIGMLYVGDDNDVLVTAIVPPLLSLIIRDSGDTADTNVCDLGELATGSVATCAYRVAVSTNASGGFQVQINSDGALDTAASDDINAIAENGTVTAGVEGYGVAITGATVGGHDGAGNFDQPLVEDGDFNDDDTPVPTSATNFISYGDAFQYTQGTATTSTLVTHRAAISAATIAGAYQQVVTYTITATF